MVEGSYEPLDDNDKSIKELESHCIGNEMHGINLGASAGNTVEDWCKVPRDAGPSGKTTIVHPDQFGDGIANGDNHMHSGETGAPNTDSIERGDGSPPVSSSEDNNADQKEYVPWEDEDIDSQADLIESDSVGTS